LKSREANLKLPRLQEQAGVAAYAPGREMAKNSRHVVPSTTGGWSVRKTGASRASKNFDRQADAVDYARTLAKKDKSDVYVHAKSGAIRTHTSYKR
jgi:hypothetical protein